MIEAGNKVPAGRNRAAPKPGGYGRERTAPAHFGERHYSTAEIGELWSLSTDVVRKLFESEPGVIVIGDPAPRGKRLYRTFQVPQSVVERVHRRLQNL
jgi:hypothetical protein